jgi:type II secretory ATPase GspE/PulE/Tfp pilus assembly ATPase PilB-like protein
MQGRSAGSGRRIDRNRIFAGRSADQSNLIKAKAARFATAPVTKAASVLYEVMEITDELRELIIIGASAIELRKRAMELGMITLRESGLHKLREGMTTIEEVVKETVL